MLDTGYGIDSNLALLHPHFIAPRSLSVGKKGCRDQARPCLVSIIVADLPSLATSHFIENVSRETTYIVL